MASRNLLFCGACLLLLGGLGMATGAPIEVAGADAVSDQEAVSVFGSARCPQLSQNGGAHCESCTTMYFYSPDDDGDENRQCYNLCESGGMACGDCDYCEVLIPCDHEVCDAAGECPNTET